MSVYGGPYSINDFDDFLLAYARELDLTPEQFSAAEKRYQAVGRLLEEPETLLAPYTPQIYPQGSIALGTAIRPVMGNEFDLDFVCVLHNRSWKPAELKQAIGKRLRGCAAYRKILEEKNRCWRLSYANEFHLDIIPACPGRRASGENVLLVPDKELKAWIVTNPKGYIRWFLNCCRLSEGGRASAYARIESMPPALYRMGKSPLQAAVQIMKFHRDLCIGNAEDAPISIIITTLAGMAYQGHPSVYETLMDLAGNMPRLIETDQFGHPVVSNPVNQEENFADKWAESPGKYECFVWWCEKLRDYVNNELVGRNCVPF